MLFLIPFLVLFIFYFYFLITISQGIKNIVNSPQILRRSNEFVSVIIPFKNEEKNIIPNLKSIIKQKFPFNNLEVIYVDDNSDDKSLLLLEEYPKPQIIKLLKTEFDQDDKAHKKKVLKYAIEQAKGEIIITTDADCVHGPNWLTNMVNQFDKNTAFVSGPVQFISDGSFFQELQKLEFSSLILVGAGLIGINKPIICNAANLGFRKSVFNNVGGYEDNLNISSGDDEFLMQKIFRETDYQIKFCLNKEAISFTNPNYSFREFYQQRKRWASKGFHYVNKHIIMKLVLIFFFYLSIPTQLLFGLFYKNIYLITFIFSMMFKALIEYKIVQIDGLKLFNKTKFYIFFFAEIFHIPYIIISSISGIFGNYEWKGRKIKR